MVEKCEQRNGERIRNQKINCKEMEKPAADSPKYTRHIW